MLVVYMAIYYHGYIYVNMPDDNLVPSDMLVSYIEIATFMLICPDDNLVSHDMLVTVNLLSTKMSTILPAVDNYVG